VNNRLITSDWIPTVNKNISKAQAETIVLHVFNEAKRHKIDPLLLLAIIRSESTFNSNAGSSEGARGLMQVLPRWHRDKIRGRNINDVKVNIEVGTTIINDCLNKYNDNVNRALGCYLGGRSAKYVAKSSATHRELKQTLVTQMFVRSNLSLYCLTLINQDITTHNLLNWNTATSCLLLMADHRIFNMLTLNHTLEDSHELADAFYKAIKECPFEKNKDLTGWADAKILFDIVVKHYLIEEGKDSTILEKKITIRDPDPKISDDMNSYLVVELLMSQLSGRVRLILNFPVSY